MPTLLLILVVSLPFVLAVACLLLSRQQRLRLPIISNYAALTLAVVVSLAAVNVELPLLGGRALVLSPVAQLGVQLLALAMLGLSMSLADEDPAETVRWLPIAWLSLGGLTLALLVTSLTLAALTFVAAGLVWAVAPPATSTMEPDTQIGPVLRYGALIALAAPLLLAALRLAEMRTSDTPKLEPLILALAIPGFGLILSVIPLHTWTVTLAAGSPRPMVLGVLGLVQTAGFVLLLRALASNPWMVQEARLPLIAGGAVSALVGGWLALSARRDDPDDWLAYAAIANGGLLLAGVGTQSQAAGTGVALLLFARTLAFVAIALAPRGTPRLERAALAAGTLTLAGTPGLAGFPGLWLVLRAVQQSAPPATALAIAAGSGLLFATAYNRWRGVAPALLARHPGRQLATGQWHIAVLIGLLILLGVAPQIVAPAFRDALRGMFFRLP